MVQNEKVRKHHPIRQNNSLGDNSTTNSRLIREFVTLGRNRYFKQLINDDKYSVQFISTKRTSHDMCFLTNCCPCKLKMIKIFKLNFNVTRIFRRCHAPSTRNISLVLPQVPLGRSVLKLYYDERANSESDDPVARAGNTTEARRANIERVDFSVVKRSGNTKEARRTR